MCPFSSILQVTHGCAGHHSDAQPSSSIKIDPQITEYRGTLKADRFLDPSIALRLVRVRTTHYWVLVPSVLAVCRTCCDLDYSSFPGKMPQATPRQYHISCSPGPHSFAPVKA